MWNVCIVSTISNSFSVHKKAFYKIKNILYRPFRTSYPMQVLQVLKMSYMESRGTL